MATDPLYKLAQRISRLERNLRAVSTQPQLGYSTIDGGVLVVRDDEGNLRATLGDQYDGTSGVVQFNGPPPPQPSAPTLTSALAGIKVRWDGTFADGSVAPLDFSKVTIHAIPTENFVTADPTDSSTIVGVLSNAAGAEVLIPMQLYSNYTVFLAAWSQSGKFSVPSVEVVGSPRQVTGADIEANSVTANEIETGFLQAGFVLSGRIQVGEAYWTPEDGLVIPQPGGGSIHFPVDGVTPARITAHLTAKSLHVEDDFTVAGYGEIIDQLGLKNGITKPTVAPSVSQFWPTSNPAALDGFTEDNQNVYTGLAEHASDASMWVAAVNFFGAGIRVIDKDTGDIGVYPDPTLDKAWTSEFYPMGGIATIGDSYYVLGSDGARNGYHYIYRINATTFNKTSELYIGSITWYQNGIPRLGSSPAGELTVTWVDGASNLKVRRYAANLSSTIATHTLETSASVDVGGTVWAEVDPGVTRFYLYRQNGSAWVYNPATWTRDTSREFARPYNATIKGAALDGPDGRMVCYDNYGSLYRMSKIATSTSFGASYTWYDGDTSGGSTTHETESSPVKTYVCAPRAWLSIETSPAPDVDVTDPTRLDKANRIGLYLEKTATGAPIWQSYMAVGARVYETDTVIAGGSIAPASNGFSTATSSPGKITSVALRADGTPMFEANGAGQGRFDGLLPPGSMIMSAVAFAPSGWLLCDGTGYSTATYPDLFAAIGYTFGGSAGTFYVPDVRGRFPVGVNAAASIVAKTLGYSEGDTTANRESRAKHLHSHSISNAGSPANEWATPNTGTNMVPRSAAFSTHNHGGATGDKGLNNSGSTDIHAQIAVNFIIKV